jgi:hypothetical protein
MNNRELPNPQRSPQLGRDIQNLQRRLVDHFEVEVFRNLEILDRLGEALAALQTEAHFTAEYPSFLAYAQRKFGLNPELTEALLKRSSERSASDAGHQ